MKADIAVDASDTPPCPDCAAALQLVPRRREGHVGEVKLCVDAVPTLVCSCGWTGYSDEVRRRLRFYADLTRRLCPPPGGGTVMKRFQP